MRNAEITSLGGRELAQHVVGRILAAGRATDAEPHPFVVLAAERGRHGPQAVVPAVAAAALEPQRAEGQIELVVHDDDALDGDLVEPGHRHHRAARLVHERPRLGQHHRHAGQPSLDDVRADPCAPAKRPPARVGEQVHDEEAGVVPGALRSAGRDCPDPTTRLRSSATVGCRRPNRPNAASGYSDAESPVEDPPDSPRRHLPRPAACPRRRRAPPPRQRSRLRALQRSGPPARSGGVLGSRDQRRTGRQHQVAGGDLRADLHALNADLDLVGQVRRLGLETDRRVIPVPAGRRRRPRRR